MLIPAALLLHSLMCVLVFLHRWFDKKKDCFMTEAASPSRQVCHLFLWDTPVPSYRPAELGAPVMLLQGLSRKALDRTLLFTWNDVPDIHHRSTYEEIFHIIHLQHECKPLYK